MSFGVGRCCVCVVYGMLERSCASLGFMLRFLLARGYRFGFFNRAARISVVDFAVEFNCVGGFAHRFCVPFLLLYAHACSGDILPFC